MFPLLILKVFSCLCAKESSLNRTSNSLTWRNDRLDQPHRAQTPRTKIKISLEHRTVYKSVPNCGCLLLWIRFVAKNLKSQVVTSDCIVRGHKFCCSSKHASLAILTVTARGQIKLRWSHFLLICAKNVHFLHYYRHNRQQRHTFRSFIAFYMINSTFFRPKTFWQSRAHVFDVVDEVYFTSLNST